MKFVTPGLKFKGTFSFDKFSATSVTRSKNPYYYNPATARDAEGNIITDVQTTGQEFLGYAKGAEWGDQSIYLEGMFSYNRIFGKVHDVNAMFLYNQKEYDNGDALPYRTQGIAGKILLYLRQPLCCRAELRLQRLRELCQRQALRLLPRRGVGMDCIFREIHGAGFRCHLQLEAESYLG